jgi:hypothetical protein
MAGNLGSLIVHLGADTASLQSDLGRANAIFQRNMAGIEKQAIQLGKAVGVGLAAAGTAIATMVKSSINTADELSKMSAKVGISTEALSALKYQAGLAGVEMAGLQTGLVKFSRTAAEAAGGSKAQARAFDAIGVSLKDVQGNLRPTDALLKEVADRFAGYKDGAGKAALAVQLFGRAGADMIPLLNDGAKGFENAKNEAEAYGLIVSTKAGKAAEQFNDNIDRLKGSAMGFANQLAERLTPSLAGITDKMAEGAKKGDDFGRSADGIATALKFAAKVAIITKGAIEGLVNMVAASIDTLRGLGTVTVGAFESMQQQVRGLFRGAVGDFDGAKEAFAASHKAMADAANKGASQIGGAWSAASDGIALAIKNADELVAAMDRPAEAAGKTAAAAAEAAGALGLVNPPIVEFGGSAKKAAKDVEDLAAAQAEFAEQTMALAADLAGPMAQAQDTYRASLVEAWAEYQSGKATMDQFVQRQQLLARQLGLTTAQLAKQGDVLGEIRAEYAQQLGMVGLSERQRAIAEAVTGATEAWKANSEALIENKQTLEQVQAGAAAAAAQVFDTTKAFEANQAQAEKYASIVRGAFDSMVDATAEWAVNGFKNAKEFWKGMVDLVKRAVAQMLAEWLKTKIIGMFTGGGGGGGWGALLGAGAMAVSGGASGSSGGDSTAMATQAAMNFATTGAGGGSFSILNPSSWVTAGKSLFDGFSASATSNTTWMGTYTADAGTGTFAPSTAGYVAAGAAGVYAGYTRYQNSNKDLGGALGGVAYGVGTYGLAVGASAAMAGGMAAGLAAIPVIGWIALAAMAVDMLSGGKLFGTKGKFHHSNLSMDVGAEGVALAQSYTLKGQKAFFGGTKWTTKQADVSPEAMAAAQEFYAALTKNREDFAKAFNAEVGSLVGGTFEAEFDKKGNVTKSSSTVFGVTYEGETQEQFASRLVAENMLDVLKQFDEQIIAMAEPYRAAVESLEQFANAAAMAQSSLSAGAEILALGADQSLSAFLRLAEGMQAGTETIDQTVQRLLQAQAQYDQFVAQFAEPVTYVDDFQAALAGIQAQMQANMDQANALARAAGAEGAATEDLIRIHEYAAKQFAAALRQLEASAQDLAFNLGLTNTGSYDAISAEIERLQGRADQGASAVRDFGSAMQTAAQRASDAINLLLGDLSPLNDQEKLQTALGGLRAGTVSQEEVLQIGRRLYASTEQYNQLFAMVQGMGGRGRAGSPDWGGGAGAAAAGGLSSAESERLKVLLEQQAQMQAGMQLQQYQTLAQQIAEIAMAREEDWQAVAERMGIDLAGLQEGLGLQSQEELDAWLDRIEEQTDSEGRNTESIVDEIQALRRDLNRLLGDGNAAADGSRNGRIASGGSRTRSEDDYLATRIGDEVGRRLEAGSSRNGRQPAVGAGSRGR